MGGGPYNGSKLYTNGRRKDQVSWMNSFKGSYDECYKWLRARG